MKYDVKFPKKFDESKDFIRCPKCKEKKLGTFRNMYFASLALDINKYYCYGCKMIFKAEEKNEKS